MRTFRMLFVAVVFVTLFCCAALAIELDGKVQPAPGHFAVISPICTQTVFTADDIMVEVGQRVEKGQVLVIMKEPPGVIKARELAIQLAEAELTNIEGALDIAQKDFKRAKDLLHIEGIALSGVSVSEYDALESRYGTAKQDVVVAQRKLACAQQALVLATTPLKAPIAGKVVSIFVRPGESAGPGRGQTIWMEILDPSVVDVRLEDVLPLSAGGFSVGESARVVRGKEEFDGKVASIPIQLDPKGNVPILVRVQNKGCCLLINEKVRVRFQ